MALKPVRQALEGRCRSMHIFAVHGVISAIRRELRPTPVRSENPPQQKLRRPLALRAEPKGAIRRSPSQTEAKNATSIA